MRIRKPNLFLISFAFSKDEYVNTKMRLVARLRAVNDKPVPNVVFRWAMGLMSDLEWSGVNESIPGAINCTGHRRLGQC